MQITPAAQPDPQLLRQRLQQLLGQPKAQQLLEYLPKVHQALPMALMALPMIPGGRQLEPHLRRFQEILPSSLATDDLLAGVDDDTLVTWVERVGRVIDWLRS